MSSDIRTLERLISLRRNTLEDLRRDLNTLNRLVEECRKKLERAQTEHQEFAEEMRRIETGILSPGQMIESRRYLDHLQEIVAQADTVRREATKQQVYARSAFDECHVGIRTLERVVERRSNSLRQAEQRKQYLVADDLEILRQGHKGNGHGLH